MQPCRCWKPWASRMSRFSTTNSPSRPLPRSESCSEQRTRTFTYREVCSWSARKRSSYRISRNPNSPAPNADAPLDVQPDPERHLTQGWVYGFANGPGGYPHDWTDVKSSDWHKFLDPNEEWEQTIYRNNGNAVRQISRTLENAKAAGAYKQW